MLQHRPAKRWLGGLPVFPDQYRTRGLNPALFLGGRYGAQRQNPIHLGLADAVQCPAEPLQLFALIAARSGDGNAAGAAYQNAQRPAVVDGISRAMIEQTFNDTVRKMILENRTAVPGLDLARALGL